VWWCSFLLWSAVQPHLTPIVMWLTLGGVWMVTGFIEYLQNVTTSSCNAVTNSHTVPFATACSKFFHPTVPLPVVVW
jgi:hypothetical protein